MAAASISTNG